MKFLFYLILILWTFRCSHEATFHAEHTSTIGYCYLAGVVVAAVITYTMWL